MLLTVDVGNSNIVYCGFINGKICFSARVATDLKRESDQYAMELAGILNLKGYKDENIDGIAVSCVVPNITPILERAFAQFCNKPVFFINLSEHVNSLYFGINIDIDNPAELGADIFASALAVKELMPLPAVIIDMGTATKITAIDEQFVLKGVAISPGLALSVNAMFSGTSTLKGIALEKPGPAAGKNTAESIKSGVIYGNACMLDGMISRFEDEIGPFKTIVATGGVAQAVIPYCKHNIHINETLISQGLYYAYKQHK